MTLDVRKLHVLCEVAARGTLAAAAEALGYTPSAISQQMAALERETSSTLLERGPGGVRLTEAGHARVAHAKVIFERLAQAEAELAAISGAAARLVRIAAFPSVAATLLPPAVASFRTAHPEITLEVRPADPDDGIALMRAGEVDLALILEAPGVQAPELEGIEAIPIFADRLFALLPAGHPLATRYRLRMEDLAEEEWIMGSSSGVCPDARIFLDVCARAGFQPRVVFRSEDYPAIQGLVAAGVGVSLIPELALATIRDDVVVRPLAPRPPYRQISVARLADRRSSAPKENMIAVLREVANSFGSRNGKLRSVG